MMIRKFLFLFAIVLISSIAVAQKPQRIGYIDMEYILENVPEYTEAQSRLSAKVISWQKKLDGIVSEIEVLKTDLSNEKPLLTSELISEREEDIQIKEEDLRKLQAAYFGPKGDLFLLRKQLVKPVQDQVYNAVQKIAVRKKYDIVLDKSSDLIMLYANKKYDISEQVLNSIVKGRKKVELEEKRSLKKEELSVKQSAAKDKIKEKEAKQAKLRAQKEAKDKLRSERIKAKQEQNQKRRDELNKPKTTPETNKSKISETDTDVPTETETAEDTEKKAKEKAKKDKRAALLERIKKQNEQKAKRKEDLKKAKEEKRKKRIEELEKRKEEKSKEKEENN